MLCFPPRFFIQQRKRCADVSSRIECIIDSRVILGGFYHASNSLAWVCECMGSIFIVFFFSFHYGCYKAVQQACVFKCMPFVDFFAVFHFLWRCLTSKDRWMRPELVCFLPLFHRFSELCLEPSDRPWWRLPQTFVFSSVFIINQAHRQRMVW